MLKHHFVALFKLRNIYIFLSLPLLQHHLLSHLIICTLGHHLVMAICLVQKHICMDFVFLDFIFQLFDASYLIVQVITRDVVPDRLEL